MESVAGAVRQRRRSQRPADSPAPRRLHPAVNVVAVAVIVHKPQNNRFTATRRTHFEVAPVRRWMALFGGLCKPTTNNPTTIAEHPPRRGAANACSPMLQHGTRIFDQVAGDRQDGGCGNSDTRHGRTNRPSSRTGCVTRAEDAHGAAWVSPTVKHRDKIPMRYSPGPKTRRPTVAMRRSILDDHAIGGWLRFRADQTHAFRCGAHGQNFVAHRESPGCVRARRVSGEYERIVEIILH
jgi:hypothetical protein